MEPRPWLPAAHDLPFLNPYQMAHIVIGWPLLQPAAIGGSNFGGFPTRERKTEEVLVRISAVAGMSGLGSIAMRMGGVFTGVLVKSDGDATKVGKSDVDIGGIMRMRVEHTGKARVVVYTGGIMSVKSIDRVDIDHDWRDRIDEEEDKELDE